MKAEQVYDILTKKEVIILATPAQKRASKRYEDKCRMFCLRLRKDKDADVIAWLALQGSANEKIKTLIRQDILKKQKS